MTTTRVFTVLLLVAMTCTHTTEPDPFKERAIPADLQPAVADVVAANNQFGCDLYRAICDKPGNVFVSPYSVATALSMTYAGAGGETAREMEEVLHIPHDASHWHEGSAALLASLNRGMTLGGYQLSIANRLWGQIGFVFLEAFLALLRTAYQAPLEQLDFAADPEAARVTINRWVEDQTNGTIKDLIRPGVLDEMTRLVLTNAIYFKGTWLARFDPRKTEPGPFWLTPTRSVSVPFMHMDKAKHRAASLEDVALLELPYRGEDLSMVIVLPHERDGLAGVEASLTAQTLERWYDSLQEAEVEIVLPRWSFTSELGLKDALSALGMPSAFDPQRADFSGMTGAAGLFIGSVIHKAFVRVDEEGTEAAAATAVTVELTSVPDLFEATHPFLFFIRDNVSGCILFLGRLVDPTVQ